MCRMTSSRVPVVQSVDVCIVSFQLLLSSLFFFNDTAPTEIYTLSLHDALQISAHRDSSRENSLMCRRAPPTHCPRSEEHTSELQSPDHLVCRLLLEKKKNLRSNTTKSTMTEATSYDYTSIHNTLNSSSTSPGPG